MTKTFSIVGQKWRGLDPYLPGILPGTTVSLIREPGNEHDRNAVAVWIDGIHVGYLSSKENVEIAHHIDDSGSDRMAATFSRSPNTAYPMIKIEL